jgi:hypothetical protein
MVIVHGLSGLWVLMVHARLYENVLVCNSLGFPLIGDGYWLIWSW